MPPVIALILTISFVAFLFVRDRSLRPMRSFGDWVVLAWITITASRPISMWFGKGIVVETPEDYLKGSPLDRTVFLILILLSIIVLSRRKINWGELLQENKWIFVFFLYHLLSVAWSDYPLVSFKRWIKELGDLSVALVLVSQKQRILGIKAVYGRLAYLLVPFSVCFIKYFPDIGRYYNRWTYEPMFCGVNTEKNALGGLSMICGLFLLWELTLKGKVRDKKDLLGRIILMAMTGWLLYKADSSTAVACFIIGICVLFLSKKLARSGIIKLGNYALVAILVSFFLFQFTPMRNLITKELNRDATLTGRTQLWSELLGEDINPIIGAGFGSFWLGPRARKYWEKYYWHPNQAHNGYIELYLNGGVIAVFLLLGCVAAALNRIGGSSYRFSGLFSFQFVFVLVGLFYNWTEAVFTHLNLVWFTMLCGMLVVPDHGEDHDKLLQCQFFCKDYE